MRKIFLFAVAGVVGLAASAASAGEFDFGKWRDHQLSAASNLLFGLHKPLSESSTESVDQGTAEADHFYVSVQHNVTGHGVILEITGWN